MKENGNIRGSMKVVNCFSREVNLKNRTSRCSRYRLWTGMLVAVLLVVFSCGKEDGGDEDQPKRLSKPEQISARVKESAVVLSWNAVENADGYHIKRYRESVDDDYVLIGSVFATSYLDNSPGKGRNHYCVYPFNQKLGEGEEGAYVTCELDGGSGGDGGDSGTLSVPNGLNAIQEDSRIYVSWNAVAGASGYNVYRSSSVSGAYSLIGLATSAYKYDSSPLTGYNYYKVTAVDANGQQSGMSSPVSCNYGSGGGTTSKPNAPTGVTVRNEGSALIPMITVRWSPVANATSYRVYRSTTASGAYYQVGSATTTTVLVDDNPREGTTYYKVKAVNSSGESDYSAYASVTYKANDVNPCPVTYGNCTASGTTITMRWTVPKGNGCGVPTKAYLRVMHPTTRQYVDLQTLSGTATSASFAYGMWVDSDGFVKVGIITENDKGTSGGVPKVYDNKNKRWIN